MDSVLILGLYEGIYELVLGHLNHRKYLYCYRDGGMVLTYEHAVLYFANSHRLVSLEEFSELSSVRWDNRSAPKLHRRTRGRASCQVR